MGKLYYSGMGPWGICHERREDLGQHDKLRDFRQQCVDEREFSHTTRPKIICAHCTNNCDLFGKFCKDFFKIIIQVMSWMIENEMKTYLVYDGNYNIINL